MSSDCQFWWNWWVNFAVALGTLLTVIVALFGDKLRARFFPPLLTFKRLGNEGEKTRLTDSKGNYVDDVRYYYIQVSNGRRWSPAEQTQVFLTRVEELGPTGLWQGRWFGNIPIRWRDQEIVPLLRTIGPAADCDFCRVEKKGALWLMPVIVPNNLSAPWTEACKFIATLQIRSSLADSEILRVLVTWDGKWADSAEEMKHHFKIRPA